MAHHVSHQYVHCSFIFICYNCRWCCAVWHPKMSPRTSSMGQIIFSFWSFEISEGILRSQKIIIGLDSFSNQRLIYLTLPLDYNILYIDYPVESCKITVFSFGPCCQFHRVTFKRGLSSRNRDMTHHVSHQNVHYS